MDDLLELAHLVSPYTICGEGNVSKRDGDNLFYIKASGTSLHTLSEQDLVPCRMNAVP
jgi:ribulose-5-phosphate 4-epimerase/fuculose-1-phosphate aldolase